METHLILFAIGDPNCEGHSISKSFIVESNKTENELVLINKKINSILGFSIMNVCESDAINFLTTDIYHIIVEHKIKTIFPLNLFEELGEDVDAVEEALTFKSPKHILQFWLDLLVHLDSDLIISILPETLLPRFYQRVSPPGYSYFME